MRIAGINYTTNANGEKLFTIHGTFPFDLYHKNVEAGRNCTGEQVEHVYAGNYDCTGLRVGMDIDILYDKAIHLPNGKTFQPIKRIDVLNK